MDFVMKAAAQADGLEPGRGKRNQSDYYGWDGGVVVAQMRLVTSEVSWKRYISLAQSRGFVVREKHWRPARSNQGDK